MTPAQFRVLTAIHDGKCYVRRGDVRVAKHMAPLGWVTVDDHGRLRTEEENERWIAVLTSAGRDALAAEKARKDAMVRIDEAPKPWIWIPRIDNDLPKLVRADGSVVCSFGNDEQYYPTQGEPPNGPDGQLMAAANVLLHALRYVNDHVSLGPRTKDLVLAAIAAATETP